MNEESYIKLLEILTSVGMCPILFLLMKVQDAINKMHNRKRLKKGEANYNQAAYPFLAIIYCFILQLFCIFALQYIEIRWPGELDRLLRLIPGTFNVYMLKVAAVNLTFYIIFLCMKQFKIVRTVEIAEWFLKITRAKEFLVFIKWDDIWKVKTRYRRIGKLLNVLTAGGVFFVAFYPNIITALDKGEVTWRNFFPVAWLIILNEFRHVLDTKDEERKEEYLPEASRLLDGKVHIETFLDAVKKYKNDGLMRLDYFHKEKGNGFTAPADLIFTEKETEDGEKTLLKEYFAKRGISPSFHEQELIPAVIQLLRKKNVVFSTSNYQMLGFAIILPVWRELLKNGRILIICREEAEEEALHWFAEELEKMSHVPEFWKCGRASEIREDISVGTLSLKEAAAEEDAGKLDDFLKHVTTVVFLDPDVFLAKGSRSLSVLVSKLQRDKVNYIICGSYRNSAVDSLSHILKTEIVLMKTFSTDVDEVLTLYWDADKQGNGGTVQFGLPDPLQPEIPVSVDMIKAGADRVYWYGEGRVPEKDIAWLAESCRYKIMGELPEERTRQRFEDLFHFEGSSGNKIRNNHFMIVEDHYYNIYETARQAAMKGWEQICLNIFSPNYMLRDFMYDKADALKDVPGLIPQYMPMYVESERNQVLFLVRRMVKHYVSEKEIRRLLLLPQEKNAKQKFLEYVKAYLGSDEITVLEEERTELDRDSNAYQSVHYYKIDDAEHKLTNYWDTAHIVYRGEETETRSVIDSTSGDFVHQNYMPGQKVTINGKYYQVERLNSQGLEYMIVVKRMGSAFQGRRYYRQVRRFHIEESQIEEKSFFFSNMITAEIKTADITASTLGLLESELFQDIAHGTYHPFTDPVCRIYLKKRFLRFSFKQMDSDLIKYAALLLNEILYSLFPDSYFYLSVGIVSTKKTLGTTPETAVGGDGGEGILALIDSKEDEGIYVFEDSQDDIGLLEALAGNFKTILELLYSYSKWEHDKHVKNAKSHKEGVYIDYGYPNKGTNHMLGRLCGYFNMVRVAPLLFSKTSTLKIEENEYRQAFDMEWKRGRICYYCGDISSELFQWLEQPICKTCQDSIVSSEEEAERILRKTQSDIRAKYNLKARASSTQILLSHNDIPIPQKREAILPLSLEPYVAYARKMPGGNIEIGINWKIPLDTYISLIAFVFFLTEYLPAELWQTSDEGQHSVEDLYSAGERRLGIYAEQAVRAKWMSLRYLYFSGRIKRARREHLVLSVRNDTFAEAYNEYVKKNGEPWVIHLA